MKKFIYGCVVILVCCFLAALGFALWPTDTPSLTADKSALNDPVLIQQGRYLATLGDCAACHTPAGAAAYSGGVALASPIGAMYSVNITPDKQNGIGDYTLDDFARAVRNGIRKDGVTLYPAMPYPSYARLSDSDVTALYAYFQHGVTADATPNRPSDIAWPLSIRWPVAIWRKLFAPEAVAFDSNRYQNPRIVRGAYIVEGLGHCGTCHTPRALTLQEEGLDAMNAAYLTGGQRIDGWFTPSLRNEPDGLKYWTEEEIVETLRAGRNAKRVIIGQPMNDMVIHSSSMWNDEDLQAVAAYLKSLPDPIAKSAAAPSQSGGESLETKADRAFLYQTSCAACHGARGEGKPNIFPALAGNNTALAADPQSLIRLVLNGYDVPVIDAAQIPMRMPHFRDRLSDRQIAEVITYMRQSWGNQASGVTEAQVAKVRDATAGE